MDQRFNKGMFSFTLAPPFYEIKKNIEIKSNQNIFYSAYIFLVENVVLSKYMLRSIINFNSHFIG